jgi:hypothetical protein
MRKFNKNLQIRPCSAFLLCANLVVDARTFVVVGVDHICLVSKCFYALSDCFAAKIESGVTAEIFVYNCAI